MLNISKLWCGEAGSMDQLRYSKTAHSKPVIVWNTTRRCNLHCKHCYSKSENRLYENELTNEEAKAFIKDIGEFGAPVLLFSGGEPTLRADLFELAKLAGDVGIRTVLSTNGTLITEATAKKLKDAGFSYVGVSLDGTNLTNDKFRGIDGAFDLAINGIRNCLNADVKPGLRFTITKYNYKEIGAIFDLVEAENIPRVCFYHLVYAGRGTNLTKEDLTADETRCVMDYILARTENLYRKGKNTEILTVDNHADSAYLYLKLKAKNPQKAEAVLKLLELNGGNSSGKGFGCVDSNGYVHPDQFWQHQTLGNVRERKFSEIWSTNSDPFIVMLRNRKQHLKGRCQNCRFIGICNGNFRVRAEAVYGDIWAPDPACYLTDKEIASE